MTGVYAGALEVPERYREAAERILSGSRPPSPADVAFFEEAARAVAALGEDGVGILTLVEAFARRLRGINHGAAMLGGGDRLLGCAIETEVLAGILDRAVGKAIRSTEENDE